MKYPTLNVLETGRDMVQTFRGYNHNLYIAESEFYDMKNLTSTHYPILSPRQQRGTYAPKINPQGLIAKDALCYVDGKYFVINEERIDMDLSTYYKDCPKTLISMGAYVIILPDKKWINTKDITDYGRIEAEYTSPEGTTVKFEMCTIDGNEYRNKDEEGKDVNVPHSATAPTEPKNLDYWIDTSSKPHALKQYSEASGMWVTVPTTYIKISATGIGDYFEKYDGVTISDVKIEALSDLNNTMVIWGKDEPETEDDHSNYIIVVGLIDEVTSQDVPITVERKMPIMDFVTESENRLWGCHYGVAANGEVVNEIYASKLGDFKNWNCFMGISTDSYVASCGTDGQFTAAVTHLGYPLFFKETCIHKVFGNTPSSFQIQTTNCRGVARGSEKSLATVNEVLYYKSRAGVCAYDGSLPQEISSALGDVVYTDAVAGQLSNKYYISMKGPDEVYHLFVYDTQKGMWHREDNTQVKEFCNCRGDLYFIDTENGIRSILGSKIKDTEPIEWMAETGIIGMGYPDKKYISRLLIRMSLAMGSRVSFYIQYDSCGTWEHACSVTGTSLRSFSVPIKPHRCDHFRFRIEGTGDAKIFSIVKTTEQGSDI